MPLTDKGQKIMSAMTDRYGPERGKSVFYASRNKGTISGVDLARAMGGAAPKIQTRAQALKIAYETQRRAARASGGVVPGYDVGGMVDPQQMPPPGMPPSPGVMPQQMPGSAPQGVAGPQMGPPPAPGMNNAPAGSPAPALGLPQGQWASGVAQNAAPPANPQNAPPIPPNAAPAEQPMGKQLMANGGALQRAGGGFSMQKAPSLSPPWQTKAEDRRLHVGPVLSNVPGRTDNHQVQVPSSSYVLPAAHISSLGQGNTLAGMSMVTKMFGNPGMPRIVHGSGAPKPSMRGLADGGSPDQSYGQPISCDISGGEYVLSPQQIINRFGDIDIGHKALDKWVMDTRKAEIATQRRLPPPAQS